MAQSYAEIRLEKVIIPTYGVGACDKNPMFLEKRVYQGSSGRVYPYPVIDKILDEKTDREWNAVILENEYLLVMVLPELGGRIQRAYDKTNGYDFVYHNEVIKPALVGLLGPWISGGIEFNWPQHHRPTTYMATSWHINENDDGSVTLDIGDVDEMYGTKVVTRFTLYPGRAYIEIKAQLYNRTNHTQTFLWWANPAVPVNDYTQSVFPPDVTAVYDHGKRDVSSFPIAHGVYYKHDYSAGVDISRYKNIPVPTSYMAYKSEFDFVGGYDYRVEAGILHIADHHISPGKKQWTWGNGDFGRAWDRNLTDNNGPYIELMTGVYTDNQPDFTYLAPGEEKVFTQYFMPYKSVGYVKNANLRVIVNFVSENGEVTITAYAPSRLENVLVSLSDRNGDILFSERTDLRVEEAYVKSVPSALKETELVLTLYDADGNVLIVSRPEERVDEPLPKPAASVRKPEEVDTNEELILIAQHLEQYRHATFESEPYYLEALRRDPLDSRANLFYGELLLKRCLLDEAERHFEAAVKRITWLTPNPYDSEAYYFLGLVKLYKEDLDGAYDAFYKATWSERECSRSFYNLALIDARRSDYAGALTAVERALTYNTGAMKARALRVFILEHLGRHEEAVKAAEENLAHDPFDYASLLFLKDKSFDERMIGRRANYIYLAIDLMNWGEGERALDVLERCPGTNPMVQYYKAYASHLIGKDYVEWLIEADKADETYAFPNTVEDSIVLSFALNARGEDRKASFLMGNLSYDRKNYDTAYNSWKKAVGLNPTVRRNLSIVLYNKMDKRDEALTELSAAWEMDKTDARILLELIQLEGKLGYSAAERFKLLDSNRDVAFRRDDLVVMYVSFLNRMGRSVEALDILLHHNFHPWEGGEGKVTKEYITALKELSLLSIREGDYEKALDYLCRAMEYPHNLGEGKLEGCKDNEIHYMRGLVYEKAGKPDSARREWIEALEGKAELKSAMYYYDQSADVIVFQALSERKLGMKDEAEKTFKMIVDYGKKHRNDVIDYDYFAVSLPGLELWKEDLSRNNSAQCHYLSGLGYLCLGEKNNAEAEFDEAMKANPDFVDCERLRRVLPLLV